MEVRAERGALVRTSGVPSGAAQESMVRLRAALAHVGLRPPTQSLTLHVHPTCTKEDVPHLDLALAAALLRLGGSLSAHADWREGATVTQEDVKAAVEVTWMTREGW